MKSSNNGASFGGLLSTTQPKPKTQAFAVVYTPYINLRLTREPWHSHIFFHLVSPPDFMQPDLTELPQESINSTNTSDLAPTSQYGLHLDQLPASWLRTSPPERNETPGGSSPGLSPLDSITRGQLSRLSLDENTGTRAKPSFQRISEYEKALLPSPPRKPNQGPGFTVVKKSGNSLNGPQLEYFPNGICSHLVQDGRSNT